MQLGTQATERYYCLQTTAADWTGSVAMHGPAHHPCRGDICVALTVSTRMASRTNLFFTRRSLSSRVCMEAPKISQGK